MISIADLIKVGGSVFGFVGVVLSVALIFWPQQLLKLNEALNRKISTDTLRVMLEKEFDITALIMQARVLAGVITLLLSLILLIIAIKL